VVWALVLWGEQIRNGYTEHDLSLVDHSPPHSSLEFAGRVENNKRLVVASGFAMLCGFFCGFRVGRHWRQLPHRHGFADLSDHSATSSAFVSGCLKAQNTPLDGCEADDDCFREDTLTLVDLEPTDDAEIVKDMVLQLFEQTILLISFRIITHSSKATDRARATGQFGKAALRFFKLNISRHRK